jgi:hypothetical protein
MNLRFLFRPKLDPAALLVTARAVQAALLALEAYMETTADRRGLVMVRNLHRALEAGWTAHAPALGVTAQSGGIPKDD